MRAIEIGRRMAELGQIPEALHAFELALEREADRLQPLEKLEAGVFLLERGGNYRAAYDAFLSLYQAGEYREETFSILADAFYEPNVPDLCRRYEKNVKGFRKYPWLFRQDFPAFEDLPLLFFPFDDDTFVPFDTATGEFLPKFSPRREEITHYFFRDLEKPVLAEDIFSQYELEYLNDNVRRSEDVARENHIYLHYTRWDVFCAYLQAVDLRELLKAEKAVFLFGDEIAQYPIDFKERFGLDYSRYPVQPVRVREVTRLIWHTQLSAHNGGDFFNEIFDFHPNLIFFSSIFLSMVEDDVALVRDALKAARSLKDAQELLFDHWKSPAMVEELYHMRTPTDKDLLVAFFLGETNPIGNLDAASRIVPAVFFQPHFENILFTLSINRQGDTVLYSQEMERIQNSSLFKGFKYVKTFTPIRRFTSSYGGSLRFYALFHPILHYGGTMELIRHSLIRNGMDTTLLDSLERDKEKTLPSDPGMFMDILSQRVRNRSFMVDPEDRLFRDSVIVRLEDAKLNPEATLTRLAAFLDLPYTETMTYCSSRGTRDPVPANEAGLNHYAAGFSLSSVYNTYDEYVGPNEKRYIEYLLRDAYAYFGYDFQVYDGSPVDEAVMEDWTAHFDTMTAVMRRLQIQLFDTYRERTGSADYDSEEKREKLIQDRLDLLRRRELETAEALMAGLRFVNRNGVPLRMCRLLEPDPALLVKPLYH